jgi:hypothetical protein
MEPRREDPPHGGVDGASPQNEEKSSRRAESKHAILPESSKNSRFSPKIVRDKLIEVRTCSQGRFFEDSG